MGDTEGGIGWRGWECDYAGCSGCLNSGVVAGKARVVEAGFWWFCTHKWADPNGAGHKGSRFVLHAYGALMLMTIGGARISCWRVLLRIVILVHKKSLSYVLLMQ